MMDAIAEPDAVRVNNPLGVMVAPLPVKGVAAGEVASELVTVKVPLRGPDADGAKVRVTEQLLPGLSAVRAQGTVTV